MSRQQVIDHVREEQEPLIPPPPPTKNGCTGTPRVDDRAAPERILFLAANGDAKEGTAHRAGLRFRDHLMAPAAVTGRMPGCGTTSTAPSSARTAGSTGRERTRPCAFTRMRLYLRRRGITARITRTGVDSSERLGHHRWVVDRPIFWLPAFRRPAVRCARSAGTITAVAVLAVTVICARRLPRRDC